MANLITDWNDLLLEAIRQTKPGPPMTARAIAIVHTCLYDAWAAYDPTAKLTRANFVAGVPHTPANVATSLHYAAYRALADQFPKVKGLFDTKMTQLGLDPTQTAINLTSPLGVGNKAAQQVLDFRQNDGANEASGYADTTGYAAVNKPLVPFFATPVEDLPRPDRWQPLTYLTDDSKPATPPYIAPHWGGVKPFALTSGSQFRPGPPIPLLSQAFLDQARHVVDVQAGLTPRQKVMAEYWADGPKSELPPGHWTLFAAYVAERDQLSLDATVKLFFAMTNAVFDASIAVWDAKRFYDYCRPITAIRYLFRGKLIRAWGGAGKGTVELPGETWKTFQVNTFPTPPFAEYVSGHSGFSMAAATVLRLFTSSDAFGYFYLQPKPLAADPTENVVGLTMRWNTFREAALDAGESRLYGGIHFYEGNVVALDMGRRVGEQAFQKAVSYWQGTA
ncbi:vanadium-dependent haloperoxidase [Hymenobacter coccineus]|uniref:Phosphatidic acid phosphatase type 2/haloperoxidase domain-containing protein n=1 Tax=Hymenobacter coccineus TaxID=1908235 RepID=A0A1G1SZK5_9BACT|nr:vanadium-dependent haloperoxidase [Hymenobacter coccineus]OGX84068.1 hypothetical protein BEN49_11695 [Hymenobacter coccineus]